MKILFIVLGGVSVLGSLIFLTLPKVDLEILDRKYDYWTLFKTPFLLFVKKETMCIIIPVIYVGIDTGFMSGKKIIFLFFYFFIFLFFNF